MSPQGATCEKTPKLLFLSLVFLETAPEVDHEIPELIAIQVIHGSQNRQGARLPSPRIRPLVKPWTEGEPPPDAKLLPVRDLLLRYVAAVVGVILCVIYQADLLRIIGLSTSFPLAGEILTGLLVGRGANFVHDFASRWLSPAGAAIR